MSKIFDKLEIRDEIGPKGFVIITNKKTGKILVEKHNMILKGAKDVLLSKLLFSAGSPDISGRNILSGLDGFYLYRIILSKNSNENKYELDFNSDCLDNKEKEDDWNYKADITSDNASIIELADQHYAIKFNLDFELQEFEPQEFNSLVILMKDPSENKKLFSRIVFDPIILTQESSLNLTYYVYF